MVFLERSRIDKQLEGNRDIITQAFTPMEKLADYLCALSAEKSGFLLELRFSVGLREERLSSTGRNRC